MNAKFKSKNSSQALAHLIEELGEAIAAAGKCARFGFESTNPLDPDNKETNWTWLGRELQDVHHAAKTLADTRFQESVKSSNEPEVE